MNEQRERYEKVRRKWKQASRKKQWSSDWRSPSRFTRDVKGDSTISESIELHEGPWLQNRVKWSKLQGIWAYHFDKEPESGNYMLWFYQKSSGNYRTQADEQETSAPGGRMIKKFEGLSTKADAEA